MLKAEVGGGSPMYEARSPKSETGLVDYGIRGLLGPEMADGRWQMADGQRGWEKFK